MLSVNLSIPIKRIYLLSFLMFILFKKKLLSFCQFHLRCCILQCKDFLFCYIAQLFCYFSFSLLYLIINVFVCLFNCLFICLSASLFSDLSNTRLLMTSCRQKFSYKHYTQKVLTNCIERVQVENWTRFNGHTVPEAEKENNDVQQEGESSTDHITEGFSQLRPGQIYKGGTFESREKSRLTN